MKKYRTKSGKVEEKLPGVNATVNPSEKTQIAMAGGANTLKDVQTILGQEGKRNNLKGQGAKHLVSFYNGDDDTGASDIGGEGPSGGEDPGPAGGMGGQDDPDEPTGVGTFGGRAVGPSFGDPNVEAGFPGIYADDLTSRTPDFEKAQATAKDALAKAARSKVTFLTKAQSAKQARAAYQNLLTTEVNELVEYSDRPKFTPAGLLEPMEVKYDPAVDRARLEVAKQDEDSFSNMALNLLAGYKKEVGVNTLTGRIGTKTSFNPLGSIGLSMALGPLSPITQAANEAIAVGRAVAGFMDKSTSPLSSTPGSFRESVANIEASITGKGTGYKGVDVEAPAPYSDPSPDYGPEGGAPEAPKKKRIRSAANNTTLAIAEEGDFTRAQIRRARRQITRFA